MDSPKPSDAVIAIAEATANKSPCQKSKRGVVIYQGYATVITRGFNSPPEGWACDGSIACRRDCGKRCVHAEMRALRQLAGWHLAEGSYGPYMLLHIKVDAEGKAVPGGPPSCYQCSKEILDCGMVAHVWLFEEMPTPHWVLYTAKDFHEASLNNGGVV